MEGKKVDLWCDTVRARTENMLSSSLNTPVKEVLLSYEVLTEMTIPADSTTTAESVSDNDSEDHVSHKTWRS